MRALGHEPRSTGSPDVAGKREKNCAGSRRRSESPRVRWTNAYGRTDVDRLLRACAARAGSPDFFVRKAIGWALREYARTDPAVVRAFVEAHPELSPLSRREALKGL